MVRKFLPAEFVVRRFHGLQIRQQRRLGIHHNVFSAGEPNNEVRAKTPGAGGDRFLLHEIAVRQHAGNLYHAPELDLSPASAHRGAA
jgi:hypothetical protein